MQTLAARIAPSPNFISQLYPFKKPHTENSGAGLLVVKTIVRLVGPKILLEVEDLLLDLLGFHEQIRTR